MKNNLRYVTFTALLLAGIGLGVVIYCGGITTPLQSSFSPMYETLGIVTKSLDRALTKIVPVDALDEAEYGEAIKARYRPDTDTGDPVYMYLNRLMQALQVHAKKPFTYEVFPVDYPEPNAFALPGGVICVTRELLDVLDTEGELVAVLAHELGHIEKAHCFDRIRFELLSRKLGERDLLFLADFALTFFLRTSFSKTQENEADAYAFQLLLETEYAPESQADCFKQFLTYLETQASREPDEAHLLRDYFATHPPLSLRLEKAQAEADKWWATHKNAERYTGYKNLEALIDFPTRDFGPEEWVVR